MENQDIVTYGAIAMVVLENILPHVPIKANSSLQVILNVLKALFGKKTV